MNNKVISVIIVLVLIVGGFMIFKNSSIAPTEVDVDTNMPVVGSDVEETVVVKEFNVEAGAFYFTPKTLTVNKGDTVKITVTNVGGVHDLKIDEFNTSTRTLNANESETITFVADKSGTFEYYCSVGNHRAKGMVGTLTVR